MRLSDASPHRDPQPKLPHEVKVAKQVRQIHHAIVKPQKPQWPAPTLSVMLPDAE
jgi:hypothetical protein